MNFASKPSSAASSAIPVIGEGTFEADVMTVPVPVLIMFCTAWSAPCKQLEPELVAISDEFAGRAKVVKIDIERSPLLAQEFGVKGVPSFGLMNQGRLVGQHPGALRRQQLRALLETLMPRSESSLRVEEYLKLAKAERVLAVDTRDAASFARAHMPGAVNLPLEEVENRVYEIASTGKAPVLYCRAGVASKAAAEKLAEQGFPVAFLEGGFLAWELAGQPIERGGQVT